VNAKQVSLSEVEEMKTPMTLLAGIVLILGGLALGASGAFHIIQPRVFQAATKILVAKPGSTSVYDPLFTKTEAERIQSPEVLTNVIADLDLNDRWGKKYNNGKRLSDSEVEQVLKVDARSVRNTEMIEINVYSGDPAEAAALANAVVRNYRVHAASLKTVTVTVIQSATPPTRASSPNRPIAIGLIISGIIMAIGGIFCLGSREGNG
jgi:capsular polysaccharide biosynthesis protein